MKLVGILQLYQEQNTLTIDIWELKIGNMYKENLIRV